MELELDMELELLRRLIVCILKLRRDYCWIPVGLSQIYSFALLRVLCIKSEHMHCYFSLPDVGNTRRAEKKGIKAMDHSE